jgi:hypothetical protein
VKPNTHDDIEIALELVLDLAFQNIIDKFDNPREYHRQMAAYKLVKQTFSRTGD